MSKPFKPAVVALLLSGCSDAEEPTCHLPTADPHVVQLVANDHVTFALYSDGSLYCWGDNSQGVGCTPVINAPFHAELLPYACLLDMAADAAAVGRVGDRRYRVWGQLDDRYPESGAFFGGGSIVQIAPTESGLLLLDDRGDVWHQGVLCFEFSEDGDCETHHVWTQLKYSGPAVKVVGDFAVACAVLESGKVECLGVVPDNNLSQKFALAPGRSLRTPTELPIKGKVVDFQLTLLHSLARMENGEIMASGSNSGGALGFSDKDLFERASFENVPGLPAAEALYKTDQGGCIQTETGELWSWGVESAYWNDTEAPIRLPPPPVKAALLSAGSNLCVSDGGPGVYCYNGGPTCSYKENEWNPLTFKSCPFTN